MPPRMQGCSNCRALVYKDQIRNDCCRKCDVERDPMYYLPCIFCRVPIRPHSGKKNRMCSNCKELFVLSLRHKYGPYSDAKVRHTVNTLQSQLVKRVLPSSGDVIRMNRNITSTGDLLPGLSEGGYRYGPSGYCLNPWVSRSLSDHPVRWYLGDGKWSEDEVTLEGVRCVNEYGIYSSGNMVKAARK